MGRAEGHNPAGGLIGVEDAIGGVELEVGHLHELIRHHRLTHITDIDDDVPPLIDGALTEVDLDGGEEEEGLDGLGYEGEAEGGLDLGAFHGYLGIEGLAREAIPIGELEWVYTERCDDIRVNEVYMGGC